MSIALSATPAKAEPAPARDAETLPSLNWPVTGPITSFFGPAHPLGLDISLRLSPGAEILASADGVVTFAGGSRCCSYGLYVIVDHGNDVTTLYAHLDAIHVAEDDAVSTGQPLGIGGNTGKSTGPHLHFELKHAGKRIDPMVSLPPSCQRLDGDWERPFAVVEPACGLEPEPQPESQFEVELRTAPARRTVWRPLVPVAVPTHL